MSLFTENDIIIDEETVYDKQHNVPIFIILMQGNTVLSDIIRKVTKAEFTHACISFNSKLSPMYSFGEKSSDPKEYTNESVNDKLGFVVQDTDDKMFKKDKIGYEVYTMYVTKSDKKKMVDRLNWFKEKNNFLGYDFVGLVKYELGLSSDGNLKKWFCSRFVAELIGQVKELGRSASLWSPQQIRDELPFISLVNKGDDLSKYNYKTTEKNMKNIKKGIYSYKENTNMGFVEKALLEMDDTHRRKGVEFDLEKNATPKMMSSLAKDPNFAVAGSQKKRTVSTTSTGKDLIDSQLKTRIENVDREKMQAILESENIVKEYNWWINCNIKDIIKVGDPNRSQQDQVADQLNFYKDGTVSYFAKIASALMQQDGIEMHEIENYIKGTYFYQTEDAQCIKTLLTLRLKYNQKITDIMHRALASNYKILGYTDSQAKVLLDDLSSNSNKANAAIGNIKNQIYQNRSKFVTNGGDCIDLTPLGFGKIFMSDGKGADFVGVDALIGVDNTGAGIDIFLQKAMTHDAVVICHGGSDDGKWIMQPISTDKNPKKYEVMDDFVQELIKEGYKKILIGACNPGTHKLSAHTYQLIRSKRVTVTYSDFSNIIESTNMFEYNLSDKLDTQLLEGEYQLIKLAESYDIDYNTIDENMDMPEVLTEGAALDKIKEYAKKVVEFVISLFKYIWKLIKKFLFFIGEKLGIVKNSQAEIKLPKIKGKLVLFENAKMQDFEITSMDQLKAIAKKSCSSIQRELSKRQNIQVRATKQLSDFVQRMQVSNESALLSETLEDFLSENMTISESLTLNEAVLSSKERKSLPDKIFGLPEKRKFPLNDYDHVVLAIKFFNRCDKKDQEELAKNIIKAMKKYKVSADRIGKNNKLRNYINGSVTEGLFSKYRYEYKEIPPKVKKKDAIYKAYEIGDKLLNSEKYKSIKRYVKKSFTGKNEYVSFLKGENNYYPLYTYKVQNNAQGRRDIFGPKFNEKEDDDYDWVDDSLIYIFGGELIDQVKQIDDCYGISDADNELYEGDFYLEYYKKTQKIKVDKKTGQVIKESVTTPVVGLTSKTPVIVDNMYNNAFTSLAMDEEIIRNCMMSSTKALLNNEDKFYVPYIPYIQESLNMDPNIGFYKDRNGIFVMNENTKLRSPSYNDVDDIDDRTILYITYGELNDTKLNDL